tara:strand:- start:41 stop:475 length:435 start_codon:yes stop_codon:yes gene_type:complete
MIGKLCLSAAALMIGAGGLGADDAKEVSKFDKVMGKYERSGETRRCVSPARLKGSRILDDTHILFQVSPKKAYLNTLPRQCRSLNIHDAITYTVRGGQLCTNDTFRVLDMTLTPGASCSFGTFEKVTKKSTDSGEKSNGAAAEE